MSSGAIKTCRRAWHGDARRCCSRGRAGDAARSRRGSEERPGVKDNTRRDSSEDRFQGEFKTRVLSWDKKKKRFSTKRTVVWNPLSKHFIRSQLSVPVHPLSADKTPKKTLHLSGQRSAGRRPATRGVAGVHRASRPNPRSTTRSGGAGEALGCASCRCPTAGTRQREGGVSGWLHDNALYCSPVETRIGAAVACVSRDMWLRIRCPKRGR